jgi:hypothetical protein
MSDGIQWNSGDTLFSSPRLSKKLGKESNLPLTFLLLKKNPPAFLQTAGGGMA